MSGQFKFKKFTIRQDKAAMKIGTDAVLLGAWCTVDGNENSVLDIGSGTGILGLMLAQRSDAMTIDAVEIDGNAYEQTTHNFEESDWGDRLYCYHCSFQGFSEEIESENEAYDLIISNPPFYSSTYKTEDEARNKARFTDALSFEDLLNGVVKILSKTGRFSVIIPFSEERNFVDLGLKTGFFLNKVCRVQANTTTKIKRSLLEFSFQEKPLKEESLILEISRHQYTEEYINLTKDFYLKM